jgi:hypothetical protein
MAFYQCTIQRSTEKRRKGPYSGGMKPGSSVFVLQSKLMLHIYFLFQPISFLYCSAAGDYVSRNSASLEPTSTPRMTEYGYSWNHDLDGKFYVFGKICPFATLTITNPKDCTGE